ncbi:VOC family protein [Mycolicibacterium moriokaense]|nr:VOC family protein [Mycolicibacterium moriokaense]
MPELIGFSHIDLTVTDRERATAWWREVMGFTLVHRHQDTTFDANAMVHPSGAVVDVMTHHSTASSDAFDERRVGLDHLSFRVADAEELDRWVAHLDAKGVAHSGIIDTGFGPTVVFRDPDQIQLELYIHPNLDDPALTEGALRRSQ